MINSKSYHSFTKSSFRSAKHSTYFNVYDEIFSKYKGKNIVFVEIGVLSGGSLFMWRDFFGPEARIIGIDYNPNARKWIESGFEIYIGDQSDPEFWRGFLKNVGHIDVVLDDGGHTYEQQIVTAECLYSSINDGGTIAIEDTHTSYMRGFGPRRYSFIEYSKNLIDRINFRYSELNNLQADRRIWSIRFYESVVSFHIDRKSTAIISSPIDNGGIADGAKDFRFKNLDAFDEKGSLVSRTFHFLLNSDYKLLKFLKSFFKGIIMSYSFKAKKYFTSVE